MTVLQTYRSPRGFLVVPVHYTHDPEKRGNWAAVERAKYPRVEAWAQEMEIDFSAWTGRPAYPAYSRRVHVATEPLIYDPRLPLRLAMDFNVSPMVWEVCQVRSSRLYVLSEISLTPASIEKCVIEFRNQYPSHQGQLIIYGDASGRARTSQTGQTDYDLVRLNFRGYPAELVFKVPLANPLVKDRLNAFARRLKGEDDASWLTMDPSCTELIADMEEVTLEAKGSGILKSSDPKNPYYRRTHASDALGYLIAQEWPVFMEAVAATDNSPRKPLKYGRLVGGMR